MFLCYIIVYIATCIVFCEVWVEVWTAQPSFMFVVLIGICALHLLK